MKVVYLSLAIFVLALGFSSARLTKRSSAVLQATQTDTTTTNTTDTTNTTTTSNTTNTTNTTTTTDLATECSTNQTGSTCIVDSVTLFNCSNLTEDSNWNYIPEFLNMTWNGSTFLGNYGANASVATITPYYFANAHQSITIKANVLFLDDWQDEQLRIYVNGTLIYSRTSDVIYHTNQTSPTSEYMDEVSAIQFEFIHSDSSISLNITSTLTQSSDVQSWALCGLQIIPNTVANVEA